MFGALFPSFWRISCPTVPHNGCEVLTALGLLLVPAGPAEAGLRPGQQEEGRHGHVSRGHVPGRAHTHTQAVTVPRGSSHIFVCCMMHSPDHTPLPECRAGQGYW